MRTLIDIPDKQINELAIVCKAKNLPRTEIIRQAIVAYIASNTPSASQAFGLWSKNAVDGLDYQEKVRSEW